MQPFFSIIWPQSSAFSKTTQVKNSLIWSKEEDIAFVINDSFGGIHLTRGRGALANANVHLYILERHIQTFKKEKEYRNGQELWLKLEKDQE